MTKNQRIDAAIELMHEADAKHGEALRMLSGACSLAAEHIVDAQTHNMDAITHMQTRRLSPRKKVSKRA